MSDRINEAITALRSAAEITSAHDALKTLSGLLKDLTLEDGQVHELQGELQEVAAQVAELQLALNAATTDLAQFKEDHGFFERAFGSERRDWAKLRKLVKARAADLARGRAMEIGLTLMLDRTATGAGRPTGLRAADWAKRVEAATAAGAEALAKVLIELRDESKADDVLVARLQEALSTHAGAMRRSKLRKLVRAMGKGLGQAARDVDLQEALYNDALITLRTLVEAEIRSNEQGFVEQTMAAEWLADVTPRLDEMVSAIDQAQAASDALETALPTEAQAARQLEESEARLAELDDQLHKLERGVTVPPRILLDRTVGRAGPIFTGPVFAGRVGAPLAGLGAASTGLASGVAATMGRRTASHSIGTSAPAAAASATAAPATAAPAVSAVASSPFISGIRPSLEHVAGLRPIPPRIVTPAVPPRPRPDPRAEQRQRIKAEIETIKEQLVARRDAVARATAEVQSKRHTLRRALAKLDHAIAVFHEYLGTWPPLSTMPVAVVGALPALDLGSGVGLAGAEGGLLPATVALAESGTVDHMVALEDLFTALLAEARAAGEAVSRELQELTASTEQAIQARLEALLGSTANLGD